MYMKKSRRGFTILELLVVIAIIGLLSTIVFVSVTSVREKAKAAITIKQLKQFSTALELYALSNNGEYPYPGDNMDNLGYGENAPWCGWDVAGTVSDNFGDPYLMQGASVDGNGNGKPFLDPLLDGGFISNANYSTILGSDVSLVYGNGAQSSGNRGPCNCVAGGGIDYILIAYDLPMIPGLTDTDQCDVPGVIASNCRPRGNLNDPVPDTYCIIKYKN